MTTVLTPQEPAVAPAPAPDRRRGRRPDLSPRTARGRAGLALLTVALLAPPVWATGDAAERAPVTVLVLVAAAAAVQRLVRGWAVGCFPDSPGLRAATGALSVVALVAALAAVPAVLGSLPPAVPAGLLVAALLAGALETSAPTPGVRDAVPFAVAAVVVHAVVLLPPTAHSTIGLVTPSAPHSGLSLVGTAAVDGLRTRGGVVEVTVRHAPGAERSARPVASLGGSLVVPLRVRSAGEASLLTYRLRVEGFCLHPFVVLAPPAAGAADDPARSTLRVTSWVGPAGAIQACP